MMELALKAVKLGGLGGCGNIMPADRVGSGLGLSVACKRLTICVGSTHGGSLRLAPFACSDSAQSPAPARHKTKVGTVRDRPTKPELKLLKDLREFIASHDLPPNEVPTTAELARQGRQDLANRVRRKGYKQVAQLLEQVLLADTGGNPQSEGVTFPHNGSGVSNDDVDHSSAMANGTFSTDLEEPDDVGSSTHGPLHGLSLSASYAKRANVNGHASFDEDLVKEASGDQGAYVSELGTDHVSFGEATVQGNFFKDRKWDTNEEDISGSTEPAGLSPDVTTEDGGDSSIKELYETSDINDDNIKNDDDEEEEEVGEEEEEEYTEDDDDNTIQIPGKPDPKSQSADIVYRKAALLRAKLLQYFDRRSEDSKEAYALPNANRMRQKNSTQQEWAQTYLDDTQSHETQKFETPQELEQLKGLLHSRELELVEASKQLEEARAMLSLARAKASAELVHVKQLTVEQDARLHAAEQALSQMKQVHLEWWGEAGRIEVAGTFNGWQHHILLEPDVSSEIPRPSGARGPMMWGTHLCLYPGVYEIKFIVDGNWQVDHRREVVMRHSNQNNILRVD